MRNEEPSSALALGTSPRTCVFVEQIATNSILIVAGDVTLG